MAAVNVDVGVGEAVGSLMDGIDNLFTSDDERAKAALMAFIEKQKPHVMQAETNLQESKHSSWFVAGWRPAIGWVCAIGFALLAFTTVAPMVGWLAGVDTSTMPNIDGSLVMNMTLAMLGLGGLRTAEKFKGVSREKNPNFKENWKP